MKKKKKKNPSARCNDHAICVIIYKKIVKVTYCKFYYKRLTNWYHNKYDWCQFNKITNIGDLPNQGVTMREQKNTSSK